MISADHPRFSCTSDMSLTIYAKIFSGPLVHTNDTPGTVLSGILFKDADMIFAFLFTISLDRLNRRHCFCFNTFNAARDLAREI